MSNPLHEMSSSELEAFVNGGGLLAEGASEAETVMGETVSTSEPINSNESGTNDLTDALDIQDPLELLIALDDDIREGRVTLAPWQVKMLLDFAEGGQSDKAPLQQILCAANGSGKDKYIIAPCVVWLCMRYRDARSVITSSSGQQLDSQTCTYIDMLCNAANRIFAPLFGGKPCWKLNYRYYRCLVTDSFVDAYATDEPRKAEGYHPVKFNARMAIFVSEDKSVPDEINIALERCSGFTHRVHVSTPGNPMGHFYDYFQTAVPRNKIKSVIELKPFDWVSYKVTAYDCPHIPVDRIENLAKTLPGGRDGVAFRSIVMAEFGSNDQMVVIPYHFVWQAVNGCKYGWKKQPTNDAGLDLSDGGDETVLAIRNGNRLLHIIPFKFDNTEDTITFLNEKFYEYGLNQPGCKINADCGGLGKPMLDRLKRQGWSSIYYIDNRHRASEPRVYKNRAAELWFRFKQLLELNELWLVDDDKTKRQLSTRFYTITSNIHQLESKLQARAKGHPSPDRADAVILAFWNYEKLAIESAPEAIVTPEKSKETVPTFSLKEYANRENGTRYNLHPSKKFDHVAIQGMIHEHNHLIRSIESTE